MEESKVDKVLEKVLFPIEAMFLKYCPKWIIYPITELIVFGVKQAWSCLFGGLLLFGILATSLYWPETIPIERYDFLFFYALLIQVSMLFFKLERPSEAYVILVFHIVGTVMEVFKTQVGSWVYPEASFFKIGNVPLFTGFMYASVGSYIARASRVFNLRYTRHPSMKWCILLALLIYINFFTHHYTIDIRLGLFGMSVVLYGITFVQYRVWRWRHQMPLVLGFVLIALFIWIAENVGTITGTWRYPSQSDVWELVSLSKMGSWYLLMIISFVLVRAVQRK